MIDLDTARRLLADAIEPGEIVDCARDDARGAVLAEVVTADRDFPPTDRSAMDGFAVRSADFEEGRAELRVVGEAAAGAPGRVQPLAAGETVRIMTGAVLPPGADAVVMVERAERPDGPSVRLVDPGLGPGQHVRARGQDLAAGGTVLEPGTRLGPPELSALAAVGRGRVRIGRRPVVHVLATGDEIVDPAATPAPHQVRNSNAVALCALLAEDGIAPRPLGIAPDREEDLGRALARGLAGDMLLVTGGVSVGKYDLVARELARAGLDELFHGVSIKPGKPILAGRVGRCVVLGLPGNPVSTFVGYRVFAAPSLARMQGDRRPEPTEVEVVLADELVARPGRTTYHLARVTWEGGTPRARPTRATGSGDVLALARADGLVITAAAGGTIPAGARLPAILWSS